MFRPFTLLAPAKINLYLHVTGKNEAGYHTLDSLIAFADIGDELYFEPADQLSLHITGEFAGGLDADGDNFITRAVRCFAQIHQIEPTVKITLTKNLPIASGIGGGTADAAASVKAISRIYDISMNEEAMRRLTEEIGADFPACFFGKPCRVTGTGDIIEPVKNLKPIHAVLVNPLIPCPTAPVFQSLTRHSGAAHDPLKWISKINDLQYPTTQMIPKISACLDALSGQNECAISRMSGSGATCFGAFKDHESARFAAGNLQRLHPDWWVKHCVIS